LKKEITSDGLFNRQPNEQYVERSFEKFKRQYWSGAAPEAESLKRLILIKWRSKIPSCPKCKIKLNEVKREGKAIGYRCERCPNRHEYSLLSNTPFQHTEWKPPELLIAAFYTANCIKPRIKNLSEELGLNRATVRRLVRWWQKTPDYKKLKRIKASPKADRYRRRAFKLLKILLR